MHARSAHQLYGAALGVTRARDSILVFHSSPGGLDGGLVDGNGVVTPPNGFPVPLTLALVLLVMLSWRAYAKVIGLLGWWRAGREVGHGSICCVAGSAESLSAWRTAATQNCFELAALV